MYWGNGNHLIRVGMFLICVGTSLLVPSPVADDGASQFDHCPEGYIGFGHTLSKFATTLRFRILLYGDITS